jgi:hypothetical protein
MGSPSVESKRLSSRTIGSSLCASNGRCLKLLPVVIVLYLFSGGLFGLCKVIT